MHLSNRNIEYYTYRLCSVLCTKRCTIIINNKQHFKNTKKIALFHSHGHTNVVKYTYESDNVDLQMVTFKTELLCPMPKLNCINEKQWKRTHYADNPSRNNTFKCLQVFC